MSKPEVGSGTASPAISTTTGRDHPKRRIFPPEYATPLTVGHFPSEAATIVKNSYQIDYADGAEVGLGGIGVVFGDGSDVVTRD